MPYRRLPTTDSARLRALKTAYKKSQIKAGANLPFSNATHMALRSVLPRFSNAMVNLDAARKNQVNKNKDFSELARKARLYISHFIQVVNMAIVRGELRADIRSFYNLNECEGTVPPLSTDADVLKWGQIIIDGNQKRIMQGGSPIYNPSIALVRVNYERFTEAYRFQKNFQNTTERSQHLVAELRSDVDALILQMWNEVEQTYSELPDVLKRERSAAYGVVYVFRKSEQQQMDAARLQAKFNFN